MAWFKSLASRSRTRDLEDLESLYVSGLNWKVMREELLYQSITFDSRLSGFFVEMMKNFQEKKDLTIPKEYLKPLHDFADSAQLEQFVRDFIREGKQDTEILKALDEIYKKEKIMVEIEKQRPSLKK